MILTRSPLSPLPATAARPDWDIFCQVVDNFGDIGVCWRLSRQIAVERRLRVRLWVDDLDRFAWLCPLLDPTLSTQYLQGVEIRRWQGTFPEVTPARFVLETFACRIPESFVERMAQLSPRPLWINLDYLSAEGWVSGCHAQPSPHPQLPLVKYFFFPGFTDDTGGLLRERDLQIRRAQFLASPVRQLHWWRALATAPPPAASLLVSLFAYDSPAIGTLLHTWEVSQQPVCCLAPVSATLPAIASYAGRSLAAGDVLRRGALEIRIVPFVEQSRYDQLLWLCDLNLVRGEDSFVRAQWAARPLVWNVYPQDERAHLIKLDAFLSLYCAALPPAAAAALRAFSQTWNMGRIEPASWQSLLTVLPALQEHARRWAAQRSREDGLLDRLVRFVSSRI